MVRRVLRLGVDGPEDDEPCERDGGARAKGVNGILAVQHCVKLSTSQNRVSTADTFCNDADTKFRRRRASTRRSSHVKHLIG